MKQSPTVVLLAVLISTVPVLGQQVASGESAPADIVYGRPGQLVNAGGFRLNLYCTGTGSPTVIFGMGRLGAGMVEGAARDLQMDARLQL